MNNHSEGKRFRVIISGRVQGVYFRANTQRQAHLLGLSGWVKNRPDGRVETVFEGAHDKVDRMLAWCKTGHPPARVDHVDSTEEDADGSFTDFKILYD
jgi:acylphosphatase